MTARTAAPAGSQGSDDAASAALQLQDVSAGYRRSTVLRQVSLTVPQGAVVALLGANGAGKTTLLRTAAGSLPSTGGQVLISGLDVTHAAAHQRARRRLCLIPEGRGVFPSLTVRDNLRMQTPPWSTEVGAVERALAAFPDLAGRLGQVAGSMSGGQQQMLALCRAWVSDPAVVLLDEVSMGLAPRVVDEIFVALRALAAQGVALLIVEQYVNRALEVADHVYLLDKGEVGFSGPPTALDQDALVQGYLGNGGTPRPKA